MAETAQLRVGDETYEIPIVEGSEGERAIDIRELRDALEAEGDRLVIDGLREARKVLFQQVNIVTGTDGIHQAGFHRLAGAVRRMNNPPVPVSALTGQVVTGVAGLRAAGEFDAFFEQPADIVRPLLDH